MSNVLMISFGISIIFIMTTLGAATVYFFKKDISSKVYTVFLGFASGIMFAASVWSLLLPSIECSAVYGKLCWVPASVGFIIGGAFLVLLDKVLPHLHKDKNIEDSPQSLLKKSTKLFLTITIHNIPEGLAVGFAFGAAAVHGESADYILALGLAVGIAIQNFPEGAAVALPMRTVKGSSNKAFLYGMGSGAVEPVFAVLGYYMAAYITFLQPWLLAFAAGAMIFVVAEDLIPDAKNANRPHLGTWGVMAGFVVMMILDVALG